MNKINSLSDLKVFDLVKLSNGKYYILMPNNLDKIYGLALYDSDSCQAFLTEYNNDNFNWHNRSCKFSFKAIYRCNSIFSLCKKFFRESGNIDNVFLEEYGTETIWERNPVVKMTQKQIEEALGYKIEIIKEEDWL